MKFFILLNTVSLKMEKLLWACRSDLCRDVVLLAFNWLNFHMCNVSRAWFQRKMCNIRPPAVFRKRWTEIQHDKILCSICCLREDPPLVCPHVCVCRDQSPNLLQRFSLKMVDFAGVLFLRSHLSVFTSLNIIRIIKSIRLFRYIKTKAAWPETLQDILSSVCLLKFSGLHSFNGFRAEVVIQR